MLGVLHVLMGGLHKQPGSLDLQLWRIITRECIGFLHYVQIGHPVSGDIVLSLKAHEPSRKLDFPL